MESENNLLSANESAEYLGITRGTLSVYVSNGKFTKHYVKLRLFLDKNELDAYLKNKKYLKNNSTQN